MTESRFARLVIADPGLIDAIGHHLGYSWSLAEAALARGLPAVILANQRFAAHPRDDGVVCMPAFRTLYQSAGRTSGVRAVAYSAVSRLPPQIGSAVTEALRVSRRVLQRGLRAADGFGGELASLLAGLGDTARDLVLLHSVSAANLESLPGAVDPGSIGTLAVVLRRTPAEMDATDAAGVPIGQLLRTLVGHFGDRLRLFADTGELADIYAALSGQTVTVVPLPVQVPAIGHTDDGGPPTLVFAGGARAEKGYALLPPLVEQLAGCARFVIHSGPIGPDSDPVVQQAHRRLRACADLGLTLIEHALSPDDYMALIGGADLLLLPYAARAYGPRSSGILAESRAMGVPAIVPAGTWMETEAGPSHTVVFHGAADFIPAVERALAALPSLTTAFRAAAEPWHGRHNPAALLSVLLGETPG